nr:ST.3 [Starmerella bombicola]
MHHTLVDTDPDYIPGSEYIFASSYENEDCLLKDGDIVLVPQPSISPNDPLNWPKWRKALQIAIILFLRGVSTALADDSYAIMQSLKKEHPDFSPHSFTNASGALFVGMGGWAILNAESAYLYGYRISYIVGTASGILANALFSQVNSKTMLHVSQLFTGAAVSVGETVSILSFAQLCYQHQLNAAVGLYVLATSVGHFAGPLIDGYVTQNLGWSWVGYTGLIFESVTLVLVVFGMEETYFDRAHFETKTTLAMMNVHEPGFVEASNGDAFMEKTRSTHVRSKSVRNTQGSELDALGSCLQIEGGINLNEPKRTIADEPKYYFERIQIITPATNLIGTGLVQYAKRTLFLFRVFLFPPVVFAGLQWTVQIGFTTIYKSLESEVWSGPPWNLASGGIALMMMPNLIGAAIGTAYATILANSSVQWFARRNNGLSEAESRLWLMLPVLVIYPLGIIIFGLGTEYHWNWPPVYIGLGFVGFGLGAAAEISISYMVDCYPGMILEGMVGLVAIYTMLSLAMAYVAPSWLGLGSLNATIICGVLGWFIIALSLPMFIWGKKMRRMTRGMYFRFIALRDSLDTD